ncbi:lactosylceramide alpha-2,3-sialyltransferase-like [Glandiceps talaboti]
MRPRRTLLMCFKILLLLGLAQCLFTMVYMVYFEITYRTVHYPCDLDTYDREQVKAAVSMKMSQSTKQNQCTPSLSRTNMKKLRDEFNSNIALFLDHNTLTVGTYKPKYSLPFGVQGYEETIYNLLKIVNTTKNPDILSRNGCKRCVVVGNSGILAGSGKGLEIDAYDAVIRINGGPTRCFEKDVGSKTTMRISYPEGAPQDPGEFDPDALFVLVPFKYKDLEWLERVATGKYVSWIGYWRPRIAQKVPIPRSHFRILNPEIFSHTAFDLVKFPQHDGKRHKNVPTVGTICVMAALTVCDEVDVAGFGYHPDDPDSKVHYYEDMKMDTAFVDPFHDISQETLFVKNLVTNGIIKDLTKGIRW